MLTAIIPSYLYTQYQDGPVPDPESNTSFGIAGIGVASIAVAGRQPVSNPVTDLQAFINAYNSLAQGYLDSVNDLSLPIYTKQSGLMLDWVALGVYGAYRPSLSAGTSFTPLGAYNTVPYSTTAYSEDIKGGTATTYVVTDDFFKRILTWNFYKGEGFQFDIPWLKRRVKQFLYGLDGVALNIDNTYEISITLSAPNNFVIHIPDIAAAPVFAACIAQGVLNVPFQYNFTVTY